MTVDDGFTGAKLGRDSVSRLNGVHLNVVCWPLALSVCWLNCLPNHQPLYAFAGSSRAGMASMLAPIPSLATWQA